jgi:hypothetical protein
MGKNVTQPPVPNYQQAATDQKEENLVATHQNAVLNNPNIFTPGYAQTTTWDDQWQPSVKVDLSPTGQQTFNLGEQTQLGLANLANDQTKNIGGLLSQPFSFGGTPQTSLNPPLPTDTHYVSGDQFAANGGVARPDLQTSLPGSGPIAGAPQAGNLAQGFDESQVARAPINAGQTAQQAIMSRLQPQIERNRTSRETQLLNQGLRPGGEAYTNAQTDLGQQENDLYTQAVLQGLGLDLQANQQGFGQAATRGQFGNEAIQNQFGMGLAGQQAGNQAQQQGFNQQVQGGQFGNEAQLASFGADIQNQQQANAAAQQRLQTALAGQQGYNQTQQQVFNQGLQSAQFGNTAQQQALAQALQMRSLPINEISALLSGSQVQQPQMQPFAQATGAPAPLFQGAQLQDQYNQNLYNQQVAQRNSGMSGLFGLGGALLGGPLGGMIGTGLGKLF